PSCTGFFCSPRFWGSPRPWWYGDHRGGVIVVPRREEPDVWHKARSSGSTMRRVTASSRSKAGRMSSSTKPHSRPRLKEPGGGGEGRVRGHQGPEGPASLQRPQGIKTPR